MFLQGSDPLISTARGKLQSRRSKVNDQINRELRMRNGAENLYRYILHLGVTVSIYNLALM